MAKTRDKAAQNRSEEEIIEIVEQAPSDFGGAGKFWNKYQKPIAAGFAGVLLVVAGVMLFNWYQQTQDEEAQTQIVQAFKDFEKDSLDKAIAGRGTYPGLKAIVEDYGGTQTGNVAKYMLGTAYLQQGKVDDGKALIESVDKGDDMVGASAWAALAFAEEEKGAFEQAAQYYEKAADAVPNKFTSPDFLVQAARCYQQAGNNARAVQAYKDLLKRYPQSQPARDAEKYIARLGGDA